jgi:hypothetical protein
MDVEPSPSRDYNPDSSPLRRDSKSVAERLTSGLGDVSAVAEDAFRGMSTLADLGLIGAYETTSTSDEELDEDESFVFLDSKAHLDEASGVGFPTLFPTVFTKLPLSAEKGCPHNVIPYHIKTLLGCGFCKLHQ